MNGVRVLACGDCRAVLGTADGNRLRVGSRTVRERDRVDCACGWWTLWRKSQLADPAQPESPKSVDPGRAAS